MVRVCVRACVRVCMCVCLKIQNWTLILKIQTSILKISILILIIQSWSFKIQNLILKSQHLTLKVSYLIFKVKKKIALVLCNREGLGKVENSITPGALLGHSWGDPRFDFEGRLVDFQSQKKNLR